MNDFWGKRFEHIEFSIQWHHSFMFKFQIRD